MALILRSVAMGIRYAAPHMKHRRGASIASAVNLPREKLAAVKPELEKFSAHVQPVARLGMPKDLLARLAQ